MLNAITAAKKNDRADAEKLADLLRVNLLPESVKELLRLSRGNLELFTATQRS